MKATEQELTTIANALCAKYGYEPVTVKYNPRLWKVMGRCDYAKRCIEVSTKWISENNKCFLIRVLKHEMAHLRFRDHGKEFSIECNRMGIQDGPYIQGPYLWPASVLAPTKVKP